MEHIITLATGDNYTLYGTLSSTGNNSESLIVFVHGLSGNQHEHQYFNAVPYFTVQGFDVLRFDFYPRARNARPLRDSSIITHAQDLETIITYASTMYKKTILVGHSMGALAILKADVSKASTIVFWDPTTHLRTLEEKNAIFDEHTNTYILQRGMDITISKEMVEQWQTIDISHLLTTITPPCSFIFAGDLRKYNDWKPLLDSDTKKYPVTIIDRASHRFIEEGVVDKLFEATLRYIQ